jgi:hypothetical protein
MKTSELPEEVRIATECSAALDRGEADVARHLAERGLAVATAGGNAKWIRRFEHLLRVAAGTPIADPPHQPPTCSFCAREARNVVAGPKAYICAECVRAYARSESTPAARQVRADDLSCSFCGARVAEPLFAGQSYYICRECVGRCVEILAD